MSDEYEKRQYQLAVDRDKQRALSSIQDTLAIIAHELKRFNDLLESQRSKKDGRIYLNISR